MTQRPVIGWKRLGELLVERGLLTTEELDDALREQEATGERLGAILVARKAVPSVVLTTVLAEQVGIALETQGGFGSGLFTKIAERYGNAVPKAVEPLPVGSSEGNHSQCAVAAESSDPAYELSALRAELEMLRARNAELEAEVKALSKKKPAKKPAARRPKSKSAAA